MSFERFPRILHRQLAIACLLYLLLLCIPASAQSVTITSPTANSTNPSAVQITAYASNEPPTFDHYEIWDTNGNLAGYKLGTVPKTSSPNAIYVLPIGTHTLSVLAVTAQGGSGGVLNQASVTFTVAESCTDSNSAQCNFDQLGIQNPDSNCSPPQQPLWVGNPCGAQGGKSTKPNSIEIQNVTEATPIPDAGNTTLNGHSIYFEETPSGAYSNVIFIAYSPSNTGSTVDSHWTLDEYVYLPNPTYNQSLELDAYYVADNAWTSFTTQCAFIYNGGPGYWAVYGGNGGWAYLNGQNGAPNVPCSTSQFATPWPNSGDPSFTGWHHVVWNFIRNPADSHGNGYVTYVSLQFDGTTYNLNYTPTYETPGSGSNNGDFAALVQLDGTANGSLDPSVYVSELNITHTP